MPQDRSPGDGLKVEGLRKRFGKIVAVDGLSLWVPRGSMVGFLGPNGAGKTTAMRAIVGMVHPDAGEISWDNRVVDDQVAGRIGYMPQERGLYPKMRVRDQLIYMARIAGVTKEVAASRADHWLERFDLVDRANSTVSDLSGGNQQRVQLAASLVHEPDLLILDEPFAGLDPVATATMRSVIAEQAQRGAAVLFSSHQLDLVSKLCEEIVVVSEGRGLASGKISELRAASPRRHLRILWQQRPMDWTPPIGTVIEADDSQITIDLPATIAMNEALAIAAEARDPIEVSFEPPGLDALFAELVAPRDQDCDSE